jgi:hypothetical protein
MGFLLCRAEAGNTLSKTSSKGSATRDVVIGLDFIREAFENERASHLAKRWHPGYHVA